MKNLQVGGSPELYRRPSAAAKSITTTFSYSRASWWLRRANEGPIDVIQLPSEPLDKVNGARPCGGTSESYGPEENVALRSIDAALGVPLVSYSI